VNIDAPLEQVPGFGMKNEDPTGKALTEVDIVHLTPAYPPMAGGIGAFVQNLARATSRNTGAHVTVVCTDIDLSGRDAKHSRQGEIDIFFIRARKIGFVIVPIGLSSLLSRADIIHSHDPFFSLLTVAALLFAKPDAKLVMSTHGGFFHTKRWATLKNLYFMSICRLLARRFSTIVACSKQDFARFSAISDRVLLIENGVDVEKFYGDGFSRKENSFLFVGRFSPNKNIEALVDLQIELHKERPGLTLDLVGDDPYNLWGGTIAPKLAKAAGVNVNYRGMLDDDAVVDAMQRARFYLLASSYEGFGLAVVEAMAAGCIPIVNNIQPMRDLISDGENGFIIDFSDIENAARKVSSILDYPSARLDQIAAAARETSRKFSWERVGGAFVEVYEHCLGRKQPQ
jgi:alpha-1,3-mannosyltransferase